MNITTTLVPASERGTIPDDLVFGATFSDHMFSQTYRDGHWCDAKIAAMQSIELHPAASVLHYGQEVFEGLKAYRRPDGGINLFRPLMNAERFNQSADRMVMPQVDKQFHLQAMSELVLAEEHWVPSQNGASLYLRPTMIATTPKLGLGPALDYKHFIITSPVGPYYREGFNPGSVYVSDVLRRAVKGGVGEAKTGGNYAASLLMGEQATAQGCTQVLWLDAVEGKYVEEVGAMNICFAYKDGTIVTPSLTGSILRGITRDSLLQLAPTLGYTIREEQIEIDVVLDGLQSGEITEVFGCGTAAVISPVGRLAYKGQDYIVNNNETGPVAQHLFDQLTGIQYGVVEDPFSWAHPIS